MGTNSRSVDKYSELVSAELRAELARAGYSIRQFAKKNDIPLATLHKTLTAQRAVDVEDLQRICTPLNIQPSEILDRAEKALLKISLKK